MPPRRKRQGPQGCRHLARQFVRFRGCAYDVLAPAREILAQWRARFAPGKRRKQGRPFTLSIRRNSPNSISPRSLGRPSRRHHHALLGTVQTCCVIAGWWPNGWRQALGVEIPEIGHLREDSIPYALQERKAKSRKARDPLRLLRQGEPRKDEGLAYGYDLAAKSPTCPKV